jgi:5-methylcytosine-specific restriction endonuclease McrA
MDRNWQEKVSQIQENERKKYKHQASKWGKKVDSLVSSWNLWIYKLNYIKPKYVSARKNTCWEDCFVYSIYRWNQKLRMQGWTKKIDSIRRNAQEVFKRTKGGMRDMEETKTIQKIGTRDIKEMLKEQKYQCALTGRELTPENCSLDHIVPLSKGGSHSPDNAQLVVMEANKAKASLTEQEFLILCKDVVSWKKI